MDFGDRARGALGKSTAKWTAAALALVPGAAFAQEEAAALAETPEGAAETADAAASTGAYAPLGVEDIKGQPTPGGWNVQEQYSEIGQQAMGLHTGLIWVMAIISIFVLGLMLYVMFRFRRGANPTPSKTTHNTLIEVVWTLVPVLILVGIAVPSISLLASQYESPPEDAITMKVTGYQWNWGYEFPDQGVAEYISNMMPEDEARAAGFPAQLEVDQRVVLPVNTPIRVQTTAADVIHSWAIPAFWFKLDAVPGRLNEKMLIVKEEGLYYGQCSELCGPRHGYMPIAVEVVSREAWEAWIVSKGGSMTQNETVEDNPVTPIDETVADAADGEAVAAAADAAAE